MGKLVLELKGKLAKSKPKAMLFAALCGEDNKFVAKVLNEYKYTDVQKEIKSTTVVANNDDLDNIAHYAILSLKDIPTGKGLDSVKRARPFVESFTSLMNESKDELALSDYCTAILYLRELQSLVLPKDLVVEPTQGQIGGQVKTFKLPKPGEKENFLTNAMQTAQQWMDRVSKEGETEDIVKVRDKDMEECASAIKAKISKDSFLNEKYGAQVVAFATWTAEQIYGCRPETVEAVKAITTDDGLIAELFNQFIQNVAASDPNRFIRILSTIVDKKDVEATVNEMLGGEKKQLPVAVSESKPIPKKWKRTVRVPEGTKPEDRKLYDTPAAPWDWDLNAMLDIAFAKVPPVNFDGKEEPVVKKEQKEDAMSWWDRHLQNAHAGTTAALKKEQQLAAM